MVSRHACMPSHTTLFLVWSKNGSVAHGTSWDIKDCWTRTYTVDTGGPPGLSERRRAHPPSPGGLLGGMLSDGRPWRKDRISSTQGRGVFRSSCNTTPSP